MQHDYEKIDPSRRRSVVESVIKTSACAQAAGVDVRIELGGYLRISVNVTAVNFVRQGVVVPGVVERSTVVERESCGRSCRSENAAARRAAGYRVELRGDIRRDRAVEERAPNGGRPVEYIQPLLAEGRTP